jgi:peptide/nickel transport system ATP-binding protein
VTVLELRDLSVDLDTRALLRGISFSIAEGEIVGLVGQSGCGKSLTSLAIAGFLPPAMRARGSILLEGSELIGASEKELNRKRGRDMTIVFQDPSAALDPLMCIGRQIALPLAKHRGLRGARLREAVRTLMEEVKLDDIPRITKSFPHQISGGQRQRAAIAAALACSPRLLIADEPTSSMDAGIQKQLVELIHDIALQKKIAVLFISHDIAVVRKIAGRILVMKDGCIVEEAEGGEIVTNPKHEYTRLLVQCAREFENALSGRAAL